MKSEEWKRGLASFVKGRGTANDGGGIHPSVTCGDSFFSENGNPFVGFADISPNRGISSMGAKILSHIHKSKRIPQSASPPAPFDKGALSLSNIHQFDPERSKPFPTNSQTRCEILLHFPLCGVAAQSHLRRQPKLLFILFSLFFLLYGGEAAHLHSPLLIEKT